MFDIDFVRAQFPALDSPWALFDNAGGSVPARQVIERVHAHLARMPVQLGASYELSRDAGAAVDAGRAAAARLLNADPGEVVLGSSSTANAALLARALVPLWAEGDEVIVTDLDHETNIGPWRRLQERGIVVREWRLRPETAALELEDLEPLLNERTRLVAFTHCSNVVGRIHDVHTIAARIRSAGALSCVDGVAYAPHRRVDVRALGVDFYLCSLYKVYGPHLSALYGRRELLEGLAGQNHFFIGEDEVPYKLEPGSVCYELTAGLPGIVEYLQELARRCGGNGSSGDALATAFELITARERELAAPLLAYLAGHPRVTLIGPATDDPAQRVPTIAFTVQGRRSSEIAPLLDKRHLAVRWGHFYAHRAIESLGLAERDGIVRVSMLHYNTGEEVERLVSALDDVL